MAEKQEVGKGPKRAIGSVQVQEDVESFVTINSKKSEPNKPEIDPLAPPVKQEEPIEDEVDDLEDEDEFTEDEQEDLNASPDESEPQQEDDDVNLYEFIAKELVNDGFLDSDFKIEKTTKGSDIKKAYSEKLKKEIEPKIKEQIFSELAEQGVNEQDLVLARLMRQGIDVNTLQNEVIVYERLRGFDKNASEELKEASVKYMYNFKGYAPEDAEVLISKAKDEEKLDDLYADSTKFFDEKYRNFIAESENQERARQKAIAEYIEKTNADIKSKLYAGELFGDKIDKQRAKALESAVYDNNEIIEIEGKKQYTTKYSKFVNEFQNNPEMRLWLYDKYANRDTDLQSIKKEVKKEVEDDFLSNYKKSVLKNVKVDKKPKNVKKQLEENKAKKSHYFSFD